MTAEPARATGAGRASGPTGVTILHCPSGSGCDRLGSCLNCLRHWPLVSQHPSASSFVVNLTSTSGAIRLSPKTFSCTLGGGGPRADEPKLPLPVKTMLERGFLKPRREDRWVRAYLPRRPQSPCGSSPRTGDIWTLFAMPIFGVSWAWSSRKARPPSQCDRMRKRAI
jgi:hypothetical protein